MAMSDSERERAKKLYAQVGEIEEKAPLAFTDWFEWTNLVCHVLEADPQQGEELRTAVERCADEFNEAWPVDPANPAVLSTRALRGALSDLSDESRFYFCVAISEVFAASPDGPHVTAITLNGIIESAEKEAK